MMRADVTDIKTKVENVCTKETSGTKKKTEFSKRLAIATTTVARTLNKMLLIKTVMTKKLRAVSLLLVCPIGLNKTVATIINSMVIRSAEPAQ